MAIFSSLSDGRIPEGPIMSLTNEDEGPAELCRILPWMTIFKGSQFGASRLLGSVQWLRF